MKSNLIYKFFQSVKYILCITKLLKFGFINFSIISANWSHTGSQQQRDNKDSMMNSQFTNFISFICYLLMVYYCNL